MTSRGEIVLDNCYDREEEIVEECPICNETSEHELVDCQVCVNEICARCYSKLNKCPYCRTSYNKTEPSTASRIEFSYWNIEGQVFDILLVVRNRIVSNQV